MTTSKNGNSGNVWKSAEEETDLFGNKIELPHRVCNECGIPKHPSSFTAVRKSDLIIGYLGICKSCRRELSRIEYQTNLRYRAHVLLSAAQTRANRFNVVYSLSVEWLEDKLETGICEATGLPLEFGTEEDYFKHPRAPSLDRIVGSEGYTEENTRVVCWQYNAAKAEGDDADVLRMAFALVERAIIRGKAV